MGLLSIIKLNKKIISAINSCDRSTCTELLDEIFEKKEDMMWKIFTKKYYIWNLIRGKDIYKTLKLYAIEKLKSSNSIDKNKGELAILVVLKTAAKVQDKKIFVKAIQREVPILSVDIIQYTSNERIEQILNDLEGVMVDDKMKIILNYISNLKSQLAALQSIVEN